jgi:Leucine-rich repeat (LRR) protein
MKKLYPLLSVLFLIYWGCEEEQEVDTTPPTVTVTFPQNNSSVFEIVSITCISSDNEGVEKVELWVNGVTTGLTDNSEPYSFDWNTTTLEDGNYTIIIRSYDTSENTTDSEPVVLTIDNSLSVPQGGNVTSITYTITEMTVEWEQSSDGDFKDYKVLYSETESGNKDTIQTYTDKSTTSYTITEFNPLIENWFWVQVTDTLGLSSIGTGMTNELEVPPNPSELYPINFSNGFQISWSQNNDDDFLSYKLYESPSEDMSNQILIFETTEREDTNYLVNGNSEDRYYQITSEDVWGLQSTSNIEFGDYLVELWGESYSVPNTTELYLHYNELTGEIPPEIGNLTNLTELRLYSNQLTGEIPPEIGNLTNLEKLYLYKNQLTGSIPLEIGNLTNLNYLWLNDNQLTGSIPSEIGNLTNLISLNLSNNQLTGSIPESICDLNLNWNYFSITNNQFCPTYPSCIEDYMGYQDVCSCGLDDDDMVYLWGNCYSIENTTQLNLSNSGLTGSIPPEIGNLTNLTRLYLGSNQLTGSIPSEIGDMTNLTQLYLHYNQLTGSIPPEIGNLTNLTELFLRSNELTGSIPSEIGNLTNLTSLMLDDNQLTGSIPPEIWNLTNLGSLYLSDNQLTGEIPSEIGQLTNLWSFGVSNNQLSGSIPPEIWNLTNLGLLYLSDNQLTGEIPSEIGQLTNLWSFGVSNNQLSGIIPEEICNIGDSTPSLSNNQFCPPYPSCVEDYVGNQDTSGCD